MYLMEEIKRISFIIEKNLNNEFAKWCIDNNTTKTKVLIEFIQSKIT